MAAMFYALCQAASVKNITINCLTQHANYLT